MEFTKGRKIVVGISSLVAGLAMSAHASFTFNINQNGNDVMALGSGSLNITAFTGSNSGSFTSSMLPSIGYLVVNQGSMTQYSGAILTGPSSFGSGGGAPNSVTGDYVGVRGPASFIFVPVGYVSGDDLSTTVTWTNKTLSGLGLTDGSYTWTWGSGSTADSFTINVGAVPEPSTYALLALGSLGVGYMVYRRRTAKTAQS